MKKGLTRGLVTAGVALFAVAALAACGSKTSDKKSEDKTIDELKISFVPSRNPDDIAVATKPMASLLQDELKKQGFKKKFKVIISTEEPLCVDKGSFEGVTASFGLMMASVTIQKIVNKMKK